MSEDNVGRNSGLPGFIGQKEETASLQFPSKKILIIAPSSDALSDGSHVPLLQQKLLALRSQRLADLFGWDHYGYYAWTYRHLPSLFSLINVSKESKIYTPGGTAVPFVCTSL